MKKEERYSLNRIATHVSDQNGSVDRRTLIRYFQSFVEKLGGDVSELKNESKQIYFSGDEKPFVEHILREFISDTGICAKIIHQKDSVYLSTDEIHDFIQRYLNDLSKAGFTEQSILEWLKKLDLLTEYKERLLLRRCHELIDLMSYNIQGSLYTYRILEMEKLTQRLERDFASTVANSFLYLKELSEVLEMIVDIQKDNIEDVPLYEDDIIGDEYRKRDAAALEFLKGNKYATDYIEKTLGKSIDEIFKTTIHDMNLKDIVQMDMTKIKPNLKGEKL